MFSLISLFAHLGQAFQVAGSLFKDMLWLRLFLVIGISFELIFQFFKADEPIWELIIWSLLFILINGVQIGYERLRLRMDEKEKRVYSMVFSNMNKYNFKKLISAAKWSKGSKHHKLVSQGVFLPELILIYQGLAEVRVNEHVIAMLRDGQFVGEMSFLTGNQTTADVVSVSDVEFLTWDKSRLEELFRKTPEIGADIQKIFNTDLIKKLIKQNISDE